MAYIEKRGKTWRYTFYATVDGEKKRITKGGFSTKAEARVHCTNLEHYYNKGFTLNNEIVFHEYFKTWYEVNKADKFTQKTLNKYKKIHEYLKAYFPHTLLKDLTKIEYQQFLNEYASTHSTYSVRRVNQAVRSCYEDAIHDGQVIKNPTYKAVTVGAVASKPDAMKFLEYDDYVKLKRHIETKETMSGHFILLALVTGARFSEIRHLTIKDFNFAENKLHLPGTKTESSDRIVSVDHKTMQRMKKYIQSKPTDMSGYIFSHFGTLISNGAVNKALKHACKHVGIDKPITLHCLRHTLCSVLLSEGCSIHFISKHLGHKNIGVTTTIYSHLLERSFEKENEKAMNILASL